MAIEFSWEKIKPVIKNKYYISFIIFLIWIIIFDQNNLIERRKNVKKLHQLEQEKDFYLDRIVNDTRRLNELRTNDENLEKFAREEYLMKKEDEDIFLILEEE
ncbi:septum formation initiator family protein [Bacteroidota bacterium]